MPVRAGADRGAAGRGAPDLSGFDGGECDAGRVDWARVAPGTRLRLGEAVAIEITSYTTPCGKIVGSFAEGRIERMSQEAHPGWSRVYARVLSAGAIRVGDRVQVESGHEEAAS